MTDNQTEKTPPAPSYPPIEYVFVERKRRPLWRIGCILLVVIWFLILLIPLFFFILATQQEITIARAGDVPDSYQHPLFQVQLVMEEDYRGLRFVTTSIHDKTDEIMCVQTNVSYILWEGKGEPATFCRCYEQDLTASMWTLLDQTLETCK